MMTRIKTIKTLAMMMAIGLMLSGCNQAHKADWQPRFEPPTPQVELAEKYYYVSFPKGHEQAFLSETEDLLRDLQDIRPEQITKIELQAPKSLARQRVEHVKRIIRAAGLDTAPIEVSEGKNSLHDEAILLIHEWDAVVADCPDWSKPHGTDYQNSLSANFGCASATNLAMMVDNPHDLEQGRAPGANRAHQGVMSVDRFRAGEIIDINRDEGVLAE